MIVRRDTEDGGDDSIFKWKSEDLARVQEVIDDTDIIKAIYQIDIDIPTFGFKYLNHDTT